MSGWRLRDAISIRSITAVGLAAIAVVLWIYAGWMWGVGFAIFFAVDVFILVFMSVDDYQWRLPWQRGRGRDGEP